ncbi:hypothetical protein CANCADRAFT_30976 [Tortispora caseinolytica NRRL Y-17796]|uniref:Matrin-type domain-containing protein n=1 Tax=Tortispora caseinolytica NRRL Y-17796 TaxID=767744 RepID=A0A1E4TDJ9_9ASCO|nr:hypothetical protein CANCADRAFT_30976 [Tortispora caseinolytica NRRL Y-17796]
MDYQNRGGSKKGAGGLAGASETNAARRSRLRALALETIDIEKDPYLFKNHLGYFECRLCLTQHLNDGSYLAHTQGKKHQNNLARRAALDQKNQESQFGFPLSITRKVRKNVAKIGRPGFDVQKIKDPVTQKLGLIFHVQYSKAAQELRPRYRIMSAVEQKVDTPPDSNYQYLVVHAEPFESIAFKIKADEIDHASSNCFDWYDKDTHTYYIQLLCS